MTKDEIINFYLDNSKYSFFTSFELSEAEKVLNNFLNNLDKLKKSGEQLSEIQIFLYIYEFVCNRMYSPNIKNSDPIHVLINNESSIEGYCILMKLLCEKLNIPFFYNTLCKLDVNRNIVDKCSSFQVIVKDRLGVSHCLHCDPFLDCPKIDDQIFKYNGTLINLSDMSNKEYFEIPLDKVTELFLDLSIKNTSFEEKEKQLNTVLIRDRKYNITLEEKYSEFKEAITKISKFLGMEIGELNSREDLKYAYDLLKLRLIKLSTPLSRKNLYVEAQGLKRIELKQKYSLSDEEVLEYSKRIIDSRIQLNEEKTQSKKHIK